MRKRIFKNMFTLASIMLLISAIGTFIIYYHFMTKQIETQMAQEGECIVNAIEMFEAEADVYAYMDKFSDEKQLRLTLIMPSGSVIYDNMNSTGLMENHGARPEVMDAQKYGTGQSVRVSDTFGRRNFYYAIRMDDGNVIRLAYTTNITFQMMLSVVPFVLVCVIGCLVIGMMVAGNMTEKIIKPINNIDLENPKKKFVYDELKPLLARINKQNDERSKNEKMRQEFSANVSHELKTPLTSISGYAELLKDGIVSQEDVPKFGEKIFKEAARMIHLVNDIINLSKLDEHRVGIEKESVDLLKIALDVTERLEIVAQKHKVSLQVKGQEVHVMAVGQMVDELIYNLCENAIKYNRSGGRVTVWVSSEGEYGRIEVSDTGIGIPKKYQDRVFERFFRVDKSHSRQTGGTGLGLAIVKHIVEYHGGEIHLSSKMGEGTKIVVLLKQSE